MNDPISDMLTRVKNAYRAKKEAVVLPHSKFKEGIANLLEARGYAAAVEKKGRRTGKFLEIKLRYNDGRPAMTGIRCISKPSRRVYIGGKDIKTVRQGFGMLIISTSKGLMSGEEARKLKLGGEAIAEVW